MPRSSPEPAWLPDFCRLPTLAAVLVVVQVLILVLALTPSAESQWTVQRFIAASLFAHWLGLTSAIIVCQLRPLLARLGPWLGLLFAWLLPVLVAAGGAWLVHQLDVSLGYGFALPGDQRAEFVSGCALVAALLSALALRYFYVQQQWQAQVRAQAKAEVEALQARIRPHFLFNSMNSIAGLVRSDPQRAERAVEDLSDLFRAALGAGQGPGSLMEELALVRHYLDIEALRLGERLQVDWQLDEALPMDLPVPRLLLQPLVENAVNHGVARLAEGGTVAITVRCEGRMLNVEIGNPCPTEPSAPGGGHQHGSDSVAHRLAYHFGPRARMEIRQTPGYYACSLSMPLP